MMTTHGGLLLFGCCLAVREIADGENARMGMRAEGRLSSGRNPKIGMNALERLFSDDDVGDDTPDLEEIEAAEKRMPAESSLHRSSGEIRYRMPSVADLLVQPFEMYSLSNQTAASNRSLNASLENASRTFAAGRTLAAS